MKKIYLLLTLPLILIASITLSEQTYAANAMTYNQCLDAVATKLNSTSSSVANLVSVERACDHVKDKTDWQGTIWLDENNRTTYNGHGVSSGAEINGASKTLYLHGNIVFNGNSNYNLVRKTYAIQITIHYCSNNDTATERPAATGTCNNELLIPLTDGSNQFYQYTTNADDNKNIRLDGASTNTGFTLQRGKKESGEYISAGGFRPITFYPNNIIEYLKANGRIDDSTTSFKLWFYRRGLLSSDENLVTNGNYDKYAAGYDAASLTIKKNASTFSTTSEVRGKKSTDLSYSSWASSYSDSDSSEDSNTTWNIQFRHKLTIDGSEYSINTTSDCPSGYTCTFTTTISNHETDKTLTYNGSANITEKLSVTDGSMTQYSSATATISKNDVVKYDSETETLYPTITFEGGCISNPDGTSVIEIDKDISQKTIIFKQTGPSSISTSGDPNAVALIPADAGDGDFNDTHEEILNLSRGEDKTITYTGFEEKVTHTYKVTKTTPYSYYASDPNVKYYGSPTYVLDSSYHDRTTSGQATCPNVTVYRITELNTENVNIQLNTTSYWNETTKKQQNVPKNLGPVYSNNTDNLTPIYANSDKDDKISLDYTYGIQIRWLNGTIFKRTQSKNSINWYAFKGDRTTQLQKYTLEVDNSSIAKTEDLPDQDVENSDNADPNGANTGDDGNITLGTNDQQVCRAATAYGSYIAHYDKDPDPSGDKSGPPYAIICAHLYRPWNYNLSITDVLVGGKNGVLANDNEPIIVNVKAKNEENTDGNQEGNPSYSPDDTQIDLYRIVAREKDLSFIENFNNYLSSLNGTTSGPTNPGFYSMDKIHTWNYVFGYDDKINGGDDEFDSSNVGPSHSNENFRDLINKNVGDHICYFARTNYSKSTIDGSADTSGKYGYGTTGKHYIYSGLTCFTVIGFPTTQIWGGNVYSEGNIITKVYEHGAYSATGIKNGNYVLGSWTDYGIIGKNNIVGLSSSKSLPKWKSNLPVYDCDNHRLTINNDGCKINTVASLPEDNVTDIGNSVVNSPRTKTKLLNIYRGKADGCYTSDDFNTTTPDCSKYSYTNTTAINSGSGGTLPNGKTKVFYSSGNIVINTDMKPYAASYTKTSDIPQYIVIADGDINIAENVEEVNAWLIAGGTINTCTDSSGKREPNTDYKRNDHDYYKDKCKVQLTVNGPVFANKINLQRTYYGDKTNTLAEKFDISAFSYYWAYSQSSLRGKASTAYMRQLAPRY